MDAAALIPGLTSPKKIGIYGGSFNPPHIGHSLAILYAMAMNDLDQVWVVPCGEHPDGKKLADFNHRYKMACIAFTRVHNCTVIPIEHFLPKPNLTNQTLKFIRKHEPNADLHLIIGQDVLANIPSWDGGIETMTSAKMIPVPRSGFDDQGHVLPEISSTEIRKMLEDDKPVERHLDFGVREYIERHRLYGEES